MNPQARKVTKQFGSEISLTWLFFSHSSCLTFCITSDVIVGSFRQIQFVLFVGKIWTTGTDNVTAANSSKPFSPKPGKRGWATRRIWYDQDEPIFAQPGGSKNFFICFSENIQCDKHKGQNLPRNKTKAGTVKKLKQIQIKQSKNQSIN